MKSNLIDATLLGRLKKAFKSHGNIIIGFDFDDTVYNHSVGYFSLAPVRSALKRAKAQGHRLICVTNNTDEDKVRDFCELHEFVPVAINKNIIAEFGKQRKIYVNIMLDDKSCLTACVYTLNAFLDWQHGKRNL